MYKAERAVILAAGMGSRMQSVTVNTPKPLLEVNGKRMIETAIEALHKNGITDICIVTGYLKEKFHMLTGKYKGITLLENPLYQTCNNISSLYAARDYIGDSIIMDGDQIIQNPEILNPEFDKSCYVSAWTEEWTKEWLLHTKGGSIVSCSRTGGVRGWQLYSVSFWSRADGQKLRSHLEQAFVRGKKTDLYWDDIALFCYPEEYRLGIRQIKKGDIIELDELEELAEQDKGYKKYLREGVEIL